MSCERTLVIGHRGYAAFAPENTLPSFELALSAGVDLVELDCHGSRDGELMVIHDPTLDRTTDATQRWGGSRLKVCDHTKDQLVELDACGGFGSKAASRRLPTLRSAMKLIQKSGVTLIERKSGDAAACVALLRDNGWVNHAVVQAFDWDYLREYHQLEPAQVLGALGPQPVGKRKPSGRRPQALGIEWLDEIKEMGCRLAVWNRQVDRAAIAAAHRRGIQVWIYTIDDLKTAVDLIGIGVDGIISNNPAIIWKALATLAPSERRKG